MRERTQLKWLTGLICILASGTAFTAWGYLLERRSPMAMSDMYPVYYHARILIEHEDPYLDRAATYVRLRSEGFLDSENRTLYDIPVDPCVYPPSSLVVLAPLALLRWGPAHLIWMGLISASMIVSAVLIWSTSSGEAPLLSAALISFILVNCVSLLFEGNAAGLAVGLCMIAAWCFIEQKQPIIGTICLAISLALKPHDAVFVWVCLLAAGGIYRKRALQTLLPTAVLVAIAITWVSQVSPHWREEMVGNITSISSRGGVNDPGPDSRTNLIVNSAINAQTVFAVYRDAPRFYNTASYTLCGLLLLLWALANLRSPVTRTRMWSALAFISPFSMLPVYHRHHDAKLLMLAVPACAILWARHRAAGRLAVFFTSLALIFNADIPRALLTNLEAGTVFSTATPYGKIIMILLARPAPLALIAMAIFFLWAYWHIHLDPPAVNAARKPNLDLVEHATSPK